MRFAIITKISTMLDFFMIAMSNDPSDIIGNTILCSRINIIVRLSGAIN